MYNTYSNFPNKTPKNLSKKRPSPWSKILYCATKKKPFRGNLAFPQCLHPVQTRTLHHRCFEGKCNYCLDACPFMLHDVDLLTCSFGFICSKDNVDQLGKIVSVLGMPDLVSYIVKCKVEVTPEIHQVITKYALRQKRSWLSLVPSGCPIPSAEGIDLLNKLLVYDHDARLTAQQAMHHLFFDPVRDRITAEVQRSSVENKKLSYGALQ